ncbi:MAG: hypothetical protein V4550_07420 [Gemmatimonadota bacterium]
MNKRIRRKRIRGLLLAELAHRFHEQADAIAWLETSQAALGDRTPREVIAAGDIEDAILQLRQVPVAE